MEEKKEELSASASKEDIRKSVSEERIRKLTHLYYSKPEIQKIIFDFSQNREICPRYFEGFGRRPDSLQYESDIFELVKKGATSFHCSEELWSQPLSLSTNMDEKQLNGLRTGWDLILDIDSKYIDYSKIYAKIIIEFLEFSGVRNIGVKFSVSGDTPILIEKKGEFSLISILEAVEYIKQKKELKVLSLDKSGKVKLSKIYDFLEHKDTIYEIIHSQSTMPLKVTGHHSVFVWDMGDIIQKKVEELKKRDFLISYNSIENPLVKKDLKIINEFDFGKNQNSKKLIKKEIIVTEDLMRLIGYFLAEGHVTNIINQVGFTFNKNEIEYINDVKSLLFSLTGKKLSIRSPNSNSVQILIHSKEWASFFDNFCGKKKDKHIPAFAFKASRELFLELLKGYIRGDGYKKGEYGVVVKSVSKRLITEMIWLCKLNNISCNLSSEQNKPHKLPQGNFFKGSLVYLLRIPKSELVNLEFHRERNKFSPYAGDRIFPTDGLKEVYNQIKPKMFNSHRAEQMTLKKDGANLNRIKKVLDWFEKFKEINPDKNSQKILDNYKKLFNSDISIIKIKDISRKEEELVYDISVEETESFFGNYYPVLLHNSGSKGFHMIIPCKAFPKEVNHVETKNMFPEWARILTKYIIEKTKPKLIEEITELFSPNKYIRDNTAPKEVMPDLILVSPRHLFRIPYSLHEKTALASVVINKNKISDFQLRDANPLKAEIKDFTPECKSGEATRLLMQALDWSKETNQGDSEKRSIEYKPIQITDKSEKNYPPCIKKILNGMADGKKRALFALLNFFCSIAMEKDELEKILYSWNEKNNPKLHEGYIKSQIAYAIKRKPVLPPNCMEFYQGISVCYPDELCKLIKNPVNYVVKKNFQSNKYKSDYAYASRRTEIKKLKTKDNFKNNN